MANNKNLEINSQALRSLIKDKGLTLSSMSQEMGFGDNYLNLCLQRGNISIPATKLMEQLYGIYLNDYRAGSMHTAGLFNVDAVVEELKALNGLAAQQYEELCDIRYALNLVAADPKIIKHELVPEEREEVNDDE